MAGMSIGPIFAGWMADQTGSYTAGFAVLSAAALFGSVFFVLAKKPVLPERGTAPAKRA